MHHLFQRGMRVSVNGTLGSDAGHCSRGRDERLQGPEGGCGRDVSVARCPAAALPADAVRDRRREELHRHLPHPSRHDVGLHEEITIEMTH